MAGRVEQFSNEPRGEADRSVSDMARRTAQRAAETLSGIDRDPIFREALVKVGLRDFVEALARNFPGHEAAIASQLAVMNAPRLAHPQPSGAEPAPRPAAEPVAQDRGEEKRREARMLAQRLAAAEPPASGKSGILREPFVDDVRRLDPIIRAGAG